MNNIMKIIRDFLNETSNSLENIKNWIDGVGNYTRITQELSLYSNFEVASIDLCTEEDYTDEDILNSAIIDATPEI